MNKPYIIYPLGDCAAVVKLGEHISSKTHQKVIQLTAAIEQNRLHGMIEAISSYTSVTVYYDPYQVSGNRPYKKVYEYIESMMETMPEIPKVMSREIRIPVCYEGEYAPDLELVSQHSGLSKEKVVRIHTEGNYRVYMIGFAPGFPYLGGMSPLIAAPRKSIPRSLIPAGSVGIAGNQTGIYSLSTPGGWQIIGRTPRSLFLPEQNPPSLLRPGDTVCFYPISQENFEKWEAATT